MDRVPIMLKLEIHTLMAKKVLNYPMLVDLLVVFEESK